MATDPTTIPSVADLQETKQYMNNINEFVSSENNILVDRDGKTRRTLAGVNDAFDSMQSGELTAQAVEAADRAEIAADAAALSGNVFTNTSDGITSGLLYFSIISPDEGYLDLYKNDGGTAIFQKQYPSTETIDNIKDKIPEYAPTGYAFSILDGENKAALGIRDDGTFEAAKAEFKSLSSAGTIDETVPNQGYAYAITDESGNIPFAINNDGTVEVARLIDRSAGNNSTVDRNGGVYPASLNFIATQGQSLAGGSDGAITTSSEYDNIGFKAFSNPPTATYPLDTNSTATTQSGGNTENPSYGTAGNIKELILKENNLSYENNDYQLLSACNGSSGAPIDEINKGGSRGTYEDAISQCQAGKEIANSTGRSFNFSAVTWTQGESDIGMDKDVYKGKLKQLASDFNADGKLITGQTNDIQFITYQLSSYQARNTIAPALLESSEEVSYIHLATPIYFLDFYDGTHIVAESSKWLGGYYGLVYKRVIVDKKEWQPLKPIGHSVLGSTIDLIFNKEGLVFDTVAMPPQVNQGFTVEDASGSSVALNSVEIIKPNRVRLELGVSAETNFSVKYGHINVVGKANYSGGGGNLRDSQGDTLTYNAISKPLHNWSVIFKYSI